jgi:hypothetical protein
LTPWARVIPLVIPKHREGALAIPCGPSDEDGLWFTEQPQCLRCPPAGLLLQLPAPGSAALELPLLGFHGWVTSVPLECEHLSHLGSPRCSEMML